MNVKLSPVIAGYVALAPTMALAHADAGAAHGFAAGFAHPWFGPDHVLAMVLVGIWAGMQSRAAAFAVPAAFLATMALGAVAGAAGWSLPAGEAAIAVSVVALGLLVAARVRMLALGASAAVAGLFAFAHGHAHGVEIPLAADGLAYGAGFLAATAALHGLGVALGLAARNPALEKGLRAAGAASACAGALILGTL